MDLTPWLDDLESRIDESVETQLLDEWREFCDGRFDGELFSPKRRKSVPSTIDWPKVLVNEALEDVSLMALQQLKGCSGAIAGGSGSLLTIRANYGVCILSTVFGAEIFKMTDEQNCLPNSRHLPGGLTAIKKALDHGIPDLRGGFGARTFDCGDFYKELLAPYPKLSSFITVYHPDTQGPMDICELLWGSNLFVDVMDHPELVKQFLQLITDTYIQFMNKWKSIAPLPSDYGYHWGMMHKGAIMIRNDSAMNFSADMFEEFIRPYDQQLLDCFGGGAVHFCGSGSHYVHHMAEMPGLFAVNMAQPSYNDMETIYKHTVDRGIKLIKLNRITAEATVKEGRNLRCCAHSA